MTFDTVKFEILHSAQCAFLWNTCIYVLAACLFILFSAVYHFFIYLFLCLVQSPDTQAWQNDYLQGTGCEMYTETLSPSFVGMTFPQASEYEMNYKLHYIYVSE